MSGARHNYTKMTPTLYQDVVRNVALHPNGIAFSDHDTQYSWADFNGRVDAVACELTAYGVKAGSTVAVYMHNSTDFPLCLYAIWRLGAIFAPINSRLSLVEATRMALDVSAVLILIDERLGPTNSAAPVPQLTSRTLVDNSHRRGSPHISVVADTHPAWFFFTSGTSGKPKAAVLTHSQLNAVVSNGLVDLMMGRLGRSDTAMAVAPLSHGALTHLLRQTRLGGHTYIYAESHFDESHVLAAIRHYSIRSVFLVPTMIRRLCATAGQTSYHDTIRVLLSGGEPMTREIIESVERVFGKVMTNYYGLAEVTGAISQADCTLIHGSTTAGHVPAGTPRCGTAISIRDADGKPVGPATRGNIWVAGENVFSGYMIDGKLDQSAIIDGWYNTKDMGYIGEDGLLYIDGRSTDMFISGGSNVYPQEIERVIRQIEWVDDCAVVGIPDQRWGEIGVAFVASKPGSRFDAEGCASRVREHLGSYKVPRRFLALDELPKTAMNKTDRKRLRDIAIQSSPAS